MQKMEMKREGAKRKSNTEAISSLHWPPFPNSLPQKKSFVATTNIDIVMGVRGGLTVDDKSFYAKQSYILGDGGIFRFS